MVDGVEQLCVDLSAHLESNPASAVRSVQCIVPPPRVAAVGDSNGKQPALKGWTCVYVYILPGSVRGRGPAKAWMMRPSGTCSMQAANARLCTMQICCTQYRASVLGAKSSSLRLQISNTQLGHTVCHEARHGRHKVLYVTTPAVSSCTRRRRDDTSVSVPSHSSQPAYSYAHQQKARG